MMTISPTDNTTISNRCLPLSCPIIRPIRFILFVGAILNVVLLLTYVPIVPLMASVRHMDMPSSQSANLIATEANPTPPAKQFDLFDAHNARKCAQNQACRPHQHVYYLKTHKTGSTTMYSIFAEYCRSHDLLPLMPRGHHINQAPPVRDGQLLLTDRPGQQKFDMVFNHHVHSTPIFKHLHNDVFKITTLREPFQHFISSFTYFRREGLPYLKAIPGPDGLANYFKNRKKYEARGYSSYTNNRQSMDLGFDMRHSFNDTQYISRFIKETESRFDLILITDYFHESLVIMKRYLRWNTQDIIYFAKLRQKKSETDKEKEDSTEVKYKQIHDNFAIADTLLYNHFLGKFKDLMNQEEGLGEEVSEFESVLIKVREFCDMPSKTGTTLYIPPGKWSDAIYMLPHKCKWLKTDEVSFTLYLQKRQRAILSYAG